MASAKIPYFGILTDMTFASASISVCLDADLIDELNAADDDLAEQLKEVS